MESKLKIFIQSNIFNENFTYYIHKLQPKNWVFIIFASASSKKSLTQIRLILDHKCHNFHHAKNLQSFMFSTDCIHIALKDNIVLSELLLEQDL